MESETIIWQGRPSPAKDVPYGVVCVLLGFLVVPLLMLAWRLLETRTQRYEVTTQRIRVVRGVLNQRFEELELYRVKDASIAKPLLLRMLGFGNLEIASADVSTPRLVLEAIGDPERVREELRAQIEKSRTARNVLQIEHS